MESEEYAVTMSSQHDTAGGFQCGEPLEVPPLVLRVGSAPALVASANDTIRQGDPPTGSRTALALTPDRTAGASASDDARHSCHYTDWHGTHRASNADRGGRHRHGSCRRDHVCGLMPVAMDEDGQLMPLYTPPLPPAVAPTATAALSLTAMLAATSATRAAAKTAEAKATTTPAEATAATTLTATSTGGGSDCLRGASSGSDGSGSNRDSCDSRDSSGRGAPAAGRAAEDGPRRRRHALPPPSSSSSPPPPALPPSPDGHMDVSAELAIGLAGAPDVDATGGEFRPAETAITDGCALIDDEEDEAGEEGQKRSVAGLSLST
ncbi:hypothetical protein MMPV_001947 [Pyropia vietnamensis]